MLKTPDITPEQEHEDTYITETFDKLSKNMPSIGFLSRKKRIKAYIEITHITDYMLKNESLSHEHALFILSLMMRKCANFQKSAMMTALNLDSIGKNVLSPIGLQFIIDVRNNLNLAPTHHTEDLNLEPNNPKAQLEK